jgi:hypothetical protein
MVHWLEPVPGDHIKQAGYLCRGAHKPPVPASFTYATCPFFRAQVRSRENSILVSNFLSDAASAIFSEEFRVHPQKMGILYDSPLRGEIFKKN